MFAPNDAIRRDYYRRPSGEDCYLRGWEAYQNEQLRSDNPYDPRSEAHQQWRSGYLDARNDEGEREAKAQVAARDWQRTHKKAI